MFDINFFKNTFQLKKEIIAHQWGIKDCSELLLKFEQRFSLKPYLFSIETTNKCNMTCVMCPRTTQMTRKIEDMNREVFKRVAEQISPHKKNEFDNWVNFIGKEISIHAEEHGENPFYFFISSQAITMHGFGEPLFDLFLKERIEILTANDLPTYFSCNPSNINLQKVEELLKAGLKYIKFSIDSLSDERMKKIRGPNANYSQAHQKILQIVDLKKKENYPVVIVICMITLKKDQDKEVKEFLRSWNDKDVYAYIKSLDNKWYIKNEESERAKSHYESQYCEFPWTSLSVMVDGTVVPCTQDFNCEMAMGNVMNKSLEEIWNSEKYKDFRMMHVTGGFPERYRCKERCDLKKVADYLQGK
jgi:radical SAM protein with 4Fe4S-binding SPASM domain